MINKKSSYPAKGKTIFQKKADDFRVPRTALRQPEIAERQPGM